MAGAMAPQPSLYPNLHHLRDLDNAGIQDLQQIVQTFPIIDNHAHNLLNEDNAYGSADFPFESITSEAQGHALMDHVHSSLPHMRGVKHLAEFYQCPETLQDVKSARYEWVRRDYPGLIRKSLEGTHAIMIAANQKWSNPSQNHGSFFQFRNTMKSGSIASPYTPRDPILRIRYMPMA